MRKLIRSSLAATALAATPFAALAADMVPIYKAPPAAVVSSTGLYFWADGSYQSVRLPTYNLGFRNTDVVNNSDRGPIQSYDPRATGYGIAGGVGYILPYGTLPAAFGANARIEIGGSYVHANASQSGTNAPAPAAVGQPGLQLVNGTPSVGFGPCNVGFPCAVASTLSTSFAAWQINLKGTSDFNFGAIMVSPSVAVFGGRSKNDQTFAQSLSEFGGVAAFYNASSAVAWTDWGMRAGLDTKYDLNRWLALGLGGTIGVAARHTSLSASDNVNTVAAFAGFAFAGASAVATDATTTAFLANAEASLIAKPTPTVTARAFVGLNYDNRVPGIAAPGFTGSVIAPTSTTPAGIYYSALTSYYAGGGVTVKFAP